MGKPSGLQRSQDPQGQSAEGLKFPVRVPCFAHHDPYGAGTALAILFAPSCPWKADASPPVLALSHEYQQVPSKSLTSFLPISPFDAKNPFLAAVTTNRKLNQGTERHLMHLELDISDSKIRYPLPPGFSSASLAPSRLRASS